MYNNGQRMAHGIYQFPDGRKFTGGLPRADLICMSGQGTMEYPDDMRVAKGMWDRTKLRRKPNKDKPSISIDVKPTGSGTITWPNGSTYNGEFMDGIPHGTGKLYDASLNVSKEGVFENGILKQEKGDEHDHSHKPAVDLSTMKESPPSPKKEDLPPPPPPPPPPKGKSMDVDSGEGSLPSASTAKKAAQDDVLLKEPPAQLPISETRLQRDGLRWVEYHGEDGSYYRGQVENDKAEGYGEYKNSGGDIYKGQWHEGEKHGEGKMKYVNGSYYHGEWESDVGHGNGTFFWSDGSWYSGGWKDDKLHGYGQFHWKDGCAYVGKYKEGKRVAIGAYYFRDGRKFTGDMSQGHLLTMKGQGSMSYTDGRFVEGYWNATRLRDQKDRAKPSVASREIPSGRGKIVWQDGSTYEGPHLDGVPHGSGGTFVSADGDIQQGDFFYGACDAAKIKSSRKRSREISPPPSSNTSREKKSLNSTQSNVGGASSSLSSSNVPSQVDSGSDSQRSAKRQRSVKDLIQQAHELSQKKAIIDQMLQKKLQQGIMHSEGGNLQTPKTNSSMGTVPLSEDMKRENTLPQTTEEPKKALSQQIPQGSAVNNIADSRQSAPAASIDNSRLEKLRQENEQIKKLLEQQKKQQEQARLKEEENKLLREQLELLKRLQQSK